VATLSVDVGYGRIACRQVAVVGHSSGFFIRVLPLLFHSRPNLPLLRGSENDAEDVVSSPVLSVHVCGAAVVIFPSLPKVMVPVCDSRCVEAAIGGTPSRGYEVKFAGMAVTPSVS